MAVITDLATASSIAAGDWLVVNQSGTDRKVDVAKLASIASSTWTPSLLLGGGSTGMTYANRGGHYQRLGDYCFFMGITALSNKGSSVGAMTIAGLPFEVKSYTAPFNVAWNDAAQNVYSVTGLPRVLNTQYFDIMGILTAGGSLSQWNHAYLNNGTTLWFSGFYKVT